MRSKTSKASSNRNSKAISNNRNSKATSSNRQHKVLPHAPSMPRRTRTGRLILMTGLAKTLLTRNIRLPGALNLLNPPNLLNPLNRFPAL